MDDVIGPPGAELESSKAIGITNISLSDVRIILPLKSRIKNLSILANGYGQSSNAVLAFEYRRIQQSYAA